MAKTKSEKGQIMTNNNLRNTTKKTPLSRTNKKKQEQTKKKIQRLNMNTMQNHARQETTKDFSIVPDKTQAQTM